MEFSVVAGLLLGALTLLWRLLRIGKRPSSYPPGPPTIPILGNLHLFPKKDIHKKLQEWAVEYGPIYSLMMGTQVLIVLSSDTAVKDLMDRRSAIYSSRPDAYIGDVASGHLRVVLIKYGPQLRMIRRMFSGLLNLAKSRSYLPYQMLENKQMLNEFLDHPNDFLSHIRRYSFSITTSFTYGWRTPTSDTDDLKELFENLEEFAQLTNTGGAGLADALPIIRWLPDILLPTRKRAKELYSREHPFFLRHWMNAKNSSTPCFCVNLAKLQKAEGFSDEQAAYISGILLEGGADTTSNTLYGFMQAMILFPDVQKRAKEEIDRVVGSKRLPVWEDAGNLQYIRGVVKEILRWMPTTPTGAIPHAVTQNDEYMGYLIPKGAGILNNVYSIHMNPERYPEPRVFDPTRYSKDFLSLADSANSPDPADRDVFTFGAGRRICPGMNVAEMNLFIAIAGILWAFDIEAERDAEGNLEIPDPEKLTQGFVVMPEPYRARIRPRSVERAEFIRREWRDAQELLDPDTKQWKKTDGELEGN